MGEQENKRNCCGKLMFPDEADLYQCFISEYSLKTNRLLLIRIIFLILHIYFMIHAFFLYGEYWMFRFFTNWGLWLIIISEIVIIGSTYWLGRNVGNCEVCKCGSGVHKYRSDVGKCVQILFSIFWTIQMIIGLVYFTFWLLMLVLYIFGIVDLEPEETKEDKDDMQIELTPFIIVFSIVKHAVPTLYVILERIYTRIRLIYNHLWFPISIGLVFFIQDLLRTRNDGRSAYPGMSYDNIISFIGVPAMFALALFIYWLGKRIGEKKYARSLISPPQQERKELDDEEVENIQNIHLEITTNAKAVEK